MGETVPGKEQLESSLRRALRQALPWLLISMAIVIVIVLVLWFTQPPENTLPDVYSVM